MMNRFRPPPMFGGIKGGLLIILLLIPALACNLTSQDEADTRVPTRAPIGQVVPTATTASVTFPTSTPSLMPTVIYTNIPPCALRTDWPQYGVVSGDTLSGIAFRAGTTTEVLVAANCLNNADDLSIGQRLYVPVVPPPPATNTPNITCTYQWFFTFGEGGADPYCPNAIVHMAAAGADFEGGRAYRYAPATDAGTDRGTIYVIYNDHTWVTYPDTHDSTQPDSDPSIVPPAGYYQPTGAIGKVWREVPEVRTRLGWAYEPVTPFSGRMQFPSVASNPAYWYVDHGKWGVVLRLTSVNMGPNLWEVVGGY